MRRFVLDASMALAWCFRDEISEPARRLRDSLTQATAVVPRVLFDLEVWNGLLKAWRRGRIRSLQGNAELLLGLPLRRVPAPLERTLELGAKHALSSYDALYLALALKESLPLATCDANLARAAGRLGVELA